MDGEIRRRKDEWMKEKKALTEKIESLEEKLRSVTAGKEESSEERIKAAECRLSAEARLVEALSEEQWRVEQRKRKECSRRIVISALEKGCPKEKALDMLRTELGAGLREDKLTEQKGGDGWLRWFFEFEREEERRELLERGDRLKGVWKLKVSEDKTFRERKKRQILDRKADYERAKNNAAKIAIDGDWICVDGSWSCWLDREARWISEKNWNIREKEKERKKLEQKLAQINKELSHDEREVSPSVAPDGRGQPAEKPSVEKNEGCSEDKKETQEGDKEGE